MCGASARGYGIWRRAAPAATEEARGSGRQPDSQSARACLAWLCLGVKREDEEHRVQLVQVQMSRRGWRPDTQPPRWCETGDVYKLLEPGHAQLAVSKPPILELKCEFFR